MLKKYVDNVNLCIGLLEEGWAWETQKGRKPELVWTKEREGHDKEE